MIDTLDLIDTYAAAGYAWLAKALPLLQAEVWFIGTLVLAGTMWAIVREVPGALEGRGDPLWGLVRYWCAAFTGVFFLHVTVAGPIADFAPRLHARRRGLRRHNGRPRQNQRQPREWLGLCSRPLSTRNSLSW